ncbi:MAG: transposase [Kineosporiaceae bacterium]|nr:transposase [Kineosporiaceae bacterium]
MPKPYPSEFRRRVLDLVESGRSVREVAALLGIAESCLYAWRSKDLTDRGVKPLDPRAVESAALAAAQQRIAELETEVKILRKAAAAVEAVVPPKRSVRPGRRPG